MSRSENETLPPGKMPQVDAPVFVFETFDDDAVVGPSLSDYELQTQVRRGGVGELWKARHIQDERAVVLRLIEAPHANRELSDRFLKSLDDLMGFEHRRVAPLQVAGRDGERIFVASEGFDGRTLARFLRVQTDALPIDRAVDFTLQILAGLSFLHGRRLVHGDLRPECVLVAKDGEHSQTHSRPRRRRPPDTRPVVGAPRARGQAIDK